MKDRFEKWGLRFSVISKIRNENYEVRNIGEVRNKKTKR